MLLLTMSVNKCKPMQANGRPRHDHVSKRSGPEITGATLPADGFCALLTGRPNGVAYDEYSRRCDVTAERFH